jgi:hypothetical protein
LVEYDVTLLRFRPQTFLKMIERLHCALLVHRLLTPDGRCGPTQRVRNHKQSVLWSLLSGLFHSQLDDPLSGLDATTKKNVFAAAIGPGSITSGCGRILVTQTRMRGGRNQPQYRPLYLT